MNIEYPNLQLIEYIAKLKLKEEIMEYRQNSKWHLMPKITMDVFMQSWPNTAGGFDAPGYCSGQAFINEYTTVVNFVEMDIFAVFFGNRAAYIIKTPEKSFYDDLLNRDMVNVGDCYKYAEYTGEMLYRDVR